MRARLASLLLLVFAVTSLIPPRSHAQGITATITGVVNDSTGSVVSDPSRALHNSP